MTENYIPLKELAERLGLDRSNTRKYAIKQGFRFVKIRTPDSRQQKTLALTEEDAEALINKRRNEGFMSGTKPIVESELGFFYIIQLIPELDPKRIKLGFAQNIEDRLAQHRTAAPTSKCLKGWPCKRSWEITAIDCLSGFNCRLIANEVFECDDIEKLIERADHFFSILPDPNSKIELAEQSPLRNSTG